MSLWLEMQLTNSQGSLGRPTAFSFFSNIRMLRKTGIQRSFCNAFNFTVMVFCLGIKPPKPDRPSNA